MPSCDESKTSYRKLYEGKSHGSQLEALVSFDGCCSTGS